MIKSFGINKLGVNRLGAGLSSKNVGGWIPEDITSKFRFWGKLSEIITIDDYVESFTTPIINNVALIPPEIAVLTDGFTVGYFDAADLTTLTKDPGTGKVSEWRDKLGSEIKLSQGTDASRPTWNANIIYFNGHWLQSGGFTGPQPNMIYMVVRTFAPGYKFLLSGNVTTHMSIVQASPKTVINNGGGTSPGLVMGNGTWYILRMLNKGNGSFFKLGDTVDTQNSGPYPLNAITLGAYYNGTNGPQMEVKELIVRLKDDSLTTNEQILYDYLKAKYSL